ncbi:MAG TPA: hypothetical protein DF613_04195 [Lachnospiraceae bacterium]|nr:hypothetical protein [Lachnospiraceae bacterium]
MDSQITTICPNCNNPVAESAKFCGKCGKRIPRCPTCGKILKNRMRFCMNDGTPIPEEILSLFPENTVTTLHREAEAVSPEETKDILHGEAEAVLPEETEDILHREVETVPPEEAEDVLSEEPEFVSSKEPETAVREEVSLEGTDTGTASAGVVQVPDTLDSEPALADEQETPKENVGKRRFCIKCGKECEDGQILCPECRKQNRETVLQANDAALSEKKRSPKSILIILIIALLLAGGCATGYFVVNGFFAGHNKDKAAAEASSSENTVTDRTYSEEKDAGQKSGTGEIAGEEEKSAAEEGTSSVVPDTSAVSGPAASEAETSEPAASTPVSLAPETSAPESVAPEIPEPEIAYEHTYEVLAGDMSWQEAKSICEEKGGYLATITSKAEYKEVCKLADKSDLTYLWIGASLQSDADEWSAISWLTGEEWSFEKWYPGEPSKEDADGTKEYYLCLWNAKYDDEDIGWTFNDQRNDIVGAFPSIAGKVGYICEYEREVKQ